MHLLHITKALFSFNKHQIPRTANDHLKQNSSAPPRKKFTPWKKLSQIALQKNLMVIAYYIARLYFLTIRTESINEDNIRQHLRAGNKLIAALWHQRILASIGYAKGFGVYQPSVMISESRDGDIIADVFRRMNFRPVRGSSSKNGKKALVAILNDLKEHSFAVHILDGPKGPKGIVKPGLIVMAVQTGTPIVPVYISVSRAWVLNSWDHCLVPKPFSKIVIRFDNPIAIPPNNTEQSFEHSRSLVEKHMLDNQRLDDRRFGRKEFI